MKEISFATRKAGGSFRLTGANKRKQQRSNRYDGASLRAIRARNGVGRPPVAA